MSEKITLDNLLDAFGEGVETTAEERWVSPDQIEDRELRDLWQHVIDARDDFENLCREFDDLMYRKAPDDDDE